MDDDQRGLEAFKKLCRRDFCRLKWYCKIIHNIMNNNNTLSRKLYTKWVRYWKISIMVNTCIFKNWACTGGFFKGRIFHPECMYSWMYK